VLSAPLAKPSTHGSMLDVQNITKEIRRISDDVKAVNV
jgi:hypothetical protein